jgi:hypothetical protein
MKLLKVSLVGLFVFCSLFVGSALHAATVTTDDSGKVVVLADVNIYEAKVVSQKGNEINISFDIDNGIGVQSGIKYGVSLVKETGGKQTLVDEFIYPEALNLSSNSTLKKNVTYLAPSSISGEYTVLVKAKSESGMPMGMGIAGKVTLTPSVKTVEILTDTCSLTVVGEKKSPKYTLVQGVDIKPTEKLLLTCSALNSSKNTVSETPLYETHLRNIYGEIVQQNGGDTTPVSFKALEKKTISLTLPVALNPQSYDVKVSLKSGDITSNFVNIHYVIRGESATIQNLSLDKDYYSKNDNAKLSFIWAPSADSFPGSRLGFPVLPVITLFASINDDKNVECISPISQKIADSSNGGKEELSASVLANCNNPQATLILKDSNGKVLDQKVLSFETKTDKPVNASSFWSAKNILIILGILIVAGFAFYFINLKKKENETNNQ